jgi:DNA topoisomerase-2
MDAKTTKTSKSGKSSRSIEEIYKKMSQREHILHRSNMYIGDTRQHNEEMWVYSDTGRMELKTISYSPGFLKIFDEVLTNALDHSTRDPTVTKIKIDFDIPNGEIQVFNDGAGIPVQIHNEHKVYVPELIFSHLLSSSNYDDNQKRIGAGVNGLGVKLANIYSTSFKLETIDSDAQLKFVQEYSENMSKISKAKVTKNTGKSFTRVTFTPDYSRFGMKGLDPDTTALLYKRVYDSIACTNERVKVYLNGGMIKGKGLSDYAKFFFDQEKIITETWVSPTNKELVWEYALVPADDYFQMSFVNGNCTFQGGKHVDYILYQITSKLKTMIETKRKIKEIKPSLIKDRLFLFLKATIVNPQFSSQTKEQLVTQSKDFGSRPEVSDAFIAKLYKTKIVDEITDVLKVKESIELKKKTDGKKSSKVFIPKLEDATFAGTKDSVKCTLLLTEGDSGKTFAMWGRPNADYFGVFPLKGKLLNVRDASVSQLINNEEINNLKQILGLKQGVVYTDASQLRYSRICILADADQDAQHIKGLLVNVFHMWWPSLLKCKEPFITTLRTPIVKVSKGKKTHEFFTEQDYEEWIKATGDYSTWNTRYYKGLGTSTKVDSKSIFTRFNQLKLDYFYKDSGCDESMLLAFEKDKRKEWLGKYNRDLYIPSTVNKVPFNDMIHKELVHFSIYDNVRSIPNIMDGLKPSQRKIIYYCLQKNITSEIKVAQLSGYVSAETAYHHGEASLQQAIIGLSQDFIGSNNLTLLRPESCFGSRLTGKDSASPRYIFTHLEKWTSIIFDKRDSECLRYNQDDGKQIEPEYFVPIIPMVLVNGCEGIGTGYSTNIPSFNYSDIIQNIKSLLDGKSKDTLIELKPWYKNFKGQIIHDDENPGSYTSSGVITRLDDKRITISEIPVGTWLTPYKEFLETLCEGYSSTSTASTVKRVSHPLTGLLKNVVNNTVDENTDIRITLEFVNKDALDKLYTENTLLKHLKLTKTISTNNMYLFNRHHEITKYDNPNDILLDYFTTRLEYYSTRKQILINKLEHDISFNEEKVRFIKGYLDKSIIVVDATEAQVVSQLETLQFKKFNNSYEYLLSLQIRALTKTKMDSLIGLLSSKHNELSILISTSERDLYRNDLDNLLKAI